MSLNHGSSRHRHSSGDIISAITSGKKSSGKINISMSERVQAEEYFSRVFLSEKSGILKLVIKVI
jgi:hypothetical protein